ncbi:SPP1 family predicted phage head-tail adaptor [Bacillus ectoiniformans]|uniref:phage head closure protein n=1 Tax=Bacillus ectoiniformans TaxID=1494429 RepID=UPI00195B8945|nr:SPP1 family predicted phage head-tail adaptor [Bacillus ectoiniformans]
MKTFKKDKKITIVETVIIKDEDGFATEVTRPVAGCENIWAYYRQASADEFYSAATTNYKIEVVFKISWRQELQPEGLKILFKGKKYAITRIDDYEGYKKDLTIYAYTIN